MKLVIIFLISMSIFAGCGLRSIPQAKNQVESSLAEVTNQYKRRLDLVPNLVATVKGYASHEQETLTAVTEARAKATAIQIDPSKATPAQLEEYQKAQGSLSQALGRLMVVSERYPDLKANTNFRDLQAQLEGTENRIAIARQRHIEAIKLFNDQVSVPPESWTNALIYHFDKMAQWTLNDEERQKAEQAPKVEF